MAEQVVIALCGVLSLWLSQSPRVGSRRWAPIVGLCARQRRQNDALQQFVRALSALAESVAAPVANVPHP